MGGSRLGEPDAATRHRFKFLPASPYGGGRHDLATAAKWLKALEAKTEEAHGEVECEHLADEQQLGNRLDPTGIRRSYRNGSSSTPTKSVALSFVAGCGPRPSLYAISSARAPRIKPG